MIALLAETNGTFRMANVHFHSARIAIAFEFCTDAISLIVRTVLKALLMTLRVLRLASIVHPYCKHVLMVTLDGAIRLFIHHLHCITHILVMTGIVVFGLRTRGDSCLKTSRVVAIHRLWLQ